MLFVYFLIIFFLFRLINIFSNTYVFYNSFGSVWCWVYFTKYKNIETITAHDIQQKSFIITGIPLRILRKQMNPSIVICAWNECFCCGLLNYTRSPFEKLEKCSLSLSFFLVSMVQQQQLTISKQYYGNSMPHLHLE